jgi:CheY-like chemotaxis protein
VAWLSQFVNLLIAQPACFYLTPDHYLRRGDAMKTKEAMESDRSPEAWSGQKGPLASLAMGSESILLVDDELLLAQLGTNLLERLGYRTRASTSGTEALALFRSDPTGYDLLISDIFMPDMSGLDLAAACKAIRPDIPSIICSGQSYLDPGIQKKIKNIGVAALLNKPFGLRQMACAVRAVLDRRHTSLSSKWPSHLSV